VSLTGVANAQVVTITLNNVSDIAGKFSQNVSATMGVLLGDTNADGVVNVGDTIQVRSHAGADITNSNFRTDINADGLINVGDTIPVRLQSGTGLSMLAESQPANPSLRLRRVKTLLDYDRTLTD
jgi:hypothetical protein